MILISSVCDVMDGLLFNKHLSTAEIEVGIEHILASPKSDGSLKLIVCRPSIGRREVINTGTLDVAMGLVGDNWLTRGSSRTNDGSGHPEMQLNLMNYRFALLIAGNRSRVPLAGDQLYFDLDLSVDNIPPGTQIAVGTTLLEVTSIPHLGCKKFVERYGLDAMTFANSGFGRRHNLRGINAKVVSSGKVTVGDSVEVLRINNANRLA